MPGSSVPMNAVENVEGWHRAEKTIEFAGGTPNAIGDHDGTGDPFDIFSVTGAVAVRVFCYCTDTLTSGGAPTLEVGTAKNTAGILAQLADATNLAVNEIYHDATPDASVEAFSVLTENLVVQDIIGTVGTANITDGTLVFVALWKPITQDGNLVAA